jgi:pilus assembly protein CpaB
MNRSRALLISILGALVATLIVFSYLQRKENELLEFSQPVKVIVATQDIPEGTRLDESHIEVKDVPKKYLMPAAITKVDELLDRTTVLPILKNTQVLDTMLSTPQQGGLAARIPKGKLAFTVAVNDVTGVAGLLQPGDYVNVLLTVETGEFQDNELVSQEYVTRVVLERVLLLAVEKKMQREITNISSTSRQKLPGSTAGGRGLRQTREKELKNVTLAVTVEESLKLTMGQEIGSIALALHSTWNDETVLRPVPLNSYDFLGVEKKVIRKSVPAWIEIRGADQINH